jgi:hypothetical protein
MRRRTDTPFAPAVPQILAIPAGQAATPIAPAPDKLFPAARLAPSAPRNLLVAGRPASAAASPFTVAETPVTVAKTAVVTVASTDPFPTPVDPFPTPVDPFPAVPSPFPTPKDPFPTPANPFAPAPSPSSPGVPVAPTPAPPPGGGNLPVTAEELDASDRAVDGPQARSGGLSGAGIKIGIISNSFNVTGGAAADQSQGLLPASGVTVIQEGPTGSDDEGRAMAELVHATAPGAQLYFASAAYSETGFAASVTALQDAGCKIIVDDVGYSDEPMFQNAGPLDTSITAAVAAGVDYFTAVGNDGSAAYQAAVLPRFVNIPGIGNVWAQTFAGGATTQQVTVAAGFAPTLALEWNAPFLATNADTITVDVLFGGNVIDRSSQLASEPVVNVTLPESNANETYSVAVVYSAGTGQPSRFKYILVGGGGGIVNATGGETTGAAYGHTMLSGVNAVGAVNILDTPSEGGALSPEPFSSTGGSEFLLAPDGTPLTAPQVSGAPEFLAPDGANTSIFQPFDGTSAAAPVAAATAALMLQADASLSDADVTALLEDSALPVASTDGAAGAGLIQANLATQYASTRVISESAQTVIRGISQPCTILDGAGAHWLMAGSGATLIESQGVDSVQAGAGADTVDLTGAQAAVYGGTGPLWVRTLGGNDTVVGGTGTLTVSGGSGGGIIYGSSSGGNVLTAGALATTILSDGTGDLVTGVGNGDVLYASDLGNDTVVGGGGVEILVGGLGGAAASGGTNTFIAGGGNPLIAPEDGNAVVTLGTGDATVLLGSGTDQVQVTNGQAGGFDVVLDFNASQDLLLLSGFAAEQTAAETSVANQYDTGGNSWLKLPDGTVLAFVGVSHLSASNVSYG